MMLGLFWVSACRARHGLLLGSLTPPIYHGCCAAQVTGYRGEFGPAERAGVQVGWEIIGVSGTAVDSKETLAGELNQPSRFVHSDVPSETDLCLLAV